MRTREEFARAEHILQMTARSIGPTGQLDMACLAGMIDALEWATGKPNTSMENYLARAEAIIRRHEKAASN